MSSPRSVGGPIREGNRVILREITATLHNSPPLQSSRRKSCNDNSHQKTAEHEVKVRFAREFADVGSVTYSAPESLSSASSFHSLSSSASTKSSCGIYPDSVLQSPNDAVDTSYLSSSIPGLDDLISACAGIRIDNEEDLSYSAHQNSQDLSQDQTFASATEDSIADLTVDLIPEENPIESSLEPSQNVTQIIANNSANSIADHVQGTQDVSSLTTVCVRDPLPVVPCERNKDIVDVIVKPTDDSRGEVTLPNSSNDITSGFKTCSFSNGLEESSLLQHTVEGTNLNSTPRVSPDKPTSDVARIDENIVADTFSVEASSIPNLVLCPTTNSVPSISLVENVDSPLLPSISSISSFAEDSVLKSIETSGHDVAENVNNLLPRYSVPSILVTNVPPENRSKSPATNEIDNTCNNRDQSETVNSSLCNTTHVEQDCVKLLSDPSTSIEAPEIQQTSETDIAKELEIVSTDRSLRKVENSPERTNSPVINTSTLGEEQDSGIVEETKLQSSSDTGNSEVFDTVGTVNLKEKDKEEEQESSFDENLDNTLTLDDVFEPEKPVPEIEYTEFKPQRQSTTLALVNEQNYEVQKSAVEQVAEDISKTTLSLEEESDHFMTATSNIFQDPTSFDFLLSRGDSKVKNRLRTESLYVKFDPLVFDVSMLPQGNTPPISEEQNGKNESPLPNVGTPKRNPAIAAIDRLLFYSPSPPTPTSAIQKTEEPQEKLEQSVEESKPDPALIIDVNMSKELKLVRATVLQLEEELEKQKNEYAAELERQKNIYQEKMNKLQTQMVQEVKSKSQMTVVVEEYEKSISRLLTEKERDRTNFEQEKTKWQEELQATNAHLSNTEAAFNDVHQKYEKLKGVVAAYKNNEAVLKESIQENVETIEALETRYDQLRNHAAAELQQANCELDSLRKQHEDEMVKLHALVRKAELKSNSLTELVEQKTKENKELTQILDEVIARVGHQNAE